MVMPCSRSASSPSTSSAKSIVVLGRAELFRIALRAPRAGRRRSASSRRAAGRSASTCRHRPSRRSGTRRVGQRGGARAARVHQKYPSRFFFSIDPASSVSIRRPCRSDVVALRISAMMSSSVVGVGFDRPGQRIAAEGAEADPPHLRRLAGLERQPVVVDHDQRARALDHRPLLGEIERHDRDVFGHAYIPTRRARSSSTAERRASIRPRGCGC